MHGGDTDMSTDYSDLRTEVKEMMSVKREEFKARELSAFSPLDQWFGVEGISAPLGSIRFFSDNSLESLARTYRRGLEDVRDGLTTRAAPDLTVKQAETSLREIEREQDCREALRYSYKADDRGTNDRLEFEEAGGLAMLAEAERVGQEPLIRPNYKLALFLDYTRWLEGRLTALDWSATAPKGCPVSRWAKEAWRWEQAAYYALMDITLSDWEQNVGCYAWMGLEAS